MSQSKPKRQSDPQYSPSTCLSQTRTRIGITGLETITRTKTGTIQYPRKSLATITERKRKSFGPKKLNRWLSVQQNMNVSALNVEPNQMNLVKLKLLDRGGSGGKIYECLIDDWFHCIIKEFNHDLMTKVELQAVQNEIKVLKSLPRTPQLIQLLFEHWSETTIQLVFPYYHGSLDHWLSKQKQKQKQKQGQGQEQKVPLSTVIHIGLEVCKALHQLHARHIIHRDIKTANILYREQHGQPLRITLTDFDTAKLLSSYDYAQTIIGTPDWTAPEVYSDDDYDISADMWSFGLLLLQLLLFAGDDSNEQQTPQPDNIELLTGEKEKFKPVISSCLSQDPRYRVTAQEASVYLSKIQI